MRRLLFVVMLVSACAAPPSQPTVIPPIDPAAAPSPRGNGTGTVVHLFEWRWEDVALECETFLGPSGYTAVQVSPVVENHVIGGRPWFERYQPVSYKLETRSGNREQFADMVSRCREAGVDVMVDVIVNHMADADLEAGHLELTGRGTAGTTFGSYDYPGLYTVDDFHHCGLTPDDNIADWEDPAQVWTCELVDLADLDTSRPNVRAQLVAYLRDLTSLGVTQFRVDTGRHVSPDDLSAMLDSVAVDYAVLEITNGGWIGYYLPIAPVTDFTYGPIVSDVFRSGDLSNLIVNSDFWSRDQHPPHSSLVFLSNHDNQRGHGVGDGVLTFKDGALYDLASAFMLAYGRGRPRVMSSFAFEDGGQGPPHLADESIAPVHGDGGLGCGGEWVCEHRRPIIAGFVGFEAATRGRPVTHAVATDADRMAFGRDGTGFAAFNRSSEPWVSTFETGMPEGTYCDAAEGPLLDYARCTGRSITVDHAGISSIAVPPMGAAGIHVAR